MAINPILQIDWCDTLHPYEFVHNETNERLMFTVLLTAQNITNTINKKLLKSIAMALRIIAKMISATHRGQIKGFANHGLMH